MLSASFARRTAATIAAAMATAVAIQGTDFR
jgi:hypothetical protein